MAPTDSPPETGRDFTLYTAFAVPVTPDGEPAREQLLLVNTGIGPAPIVTPTADALREIIDQIASGMAGAISEIRLYSFTRCTQVDVVKPTLIVKAAPSPARQRLGVVR